MSIPLYRMEEHNEAYYYWNLFIEKGYIGKSGNYLLHVDHHDDMEGGGYDWDFTRSDVSSDISPDVLSDVSSDILPEVSSDILPDVSSDISLEEARELAYGRLGIADFIIPAIYQGIFSEVHVVKSLVRKPMVLEEQFVKCIGGCELIRGKMIPFLHASWRGRADSPYRFFTWREGGFEPITIERDLVLDIDLDYFCWDDSLKSVPPKRMEITEQAYQEFVQNPYHPFRILPKRLLRAEEEAGGYYLVYEEHIPRKEPPARERILKRMDKLLGWFVECGLEPKAIDICRSRCSGYLPAGVHPWLEEEFIQKLRKMMDIEIM